MRVAVLARTRQIVVSKMSTSAAIPSSSYLQKEVVTARVCSAIKDMYALPAVGDKDHFVATLGLDSLQRKAVLERLSSEFCVSIPTSQAETILSIDSAVKFFGEHPKAR
jgi:acyl carrier protein